MLHPQDLPEYKGGETMNIVSRLGATILALAIAYPVFAQSTSPTGKTAPVNPSATAPAKAATPKVTRSPLSRPLMMVTTSANDLAFRGSRARLFQVSPACRYGRCREVTVRRRSH